MFDSALVAKALDRFADTHKGQEFTNELDAVREWVNDGMQSDSCPSEWWDNYTPLYVSDHEKLVKANFAKAVDAYECATAESAITFLESYAPSGLAPYLLNENADRLGEEFSDWLTEIYPALKEHADALESGELLGNFDGYRVATETGWNVAKPQDFNLEFEWDMLGENVAVGDWGQWVIRGDVEGDANSDLINRVIEALRENDNFDGGSAEDVLKKLRSRGVEMAFILSLGSQGEQVTTDIENSAFGNPFSRLNPLLVVGENAEMIARNIIAIQWEISQFDLWDAVECDNDFKVIIPTENYFRYVANDVDSTGFNSPTAEELRGAI